MTNVEVNAARPAQGGGTQRPRARIRDAATLIILDRSGPAVLMGRRSARHTFLPGVFVFPGGRVDRGDWRTRLAGTYDDGTLKNLTIRMRSGQGEARARALGVTAVRETYEETGVLVGRTDARDHVPSGDAWTPFAERGVALDLGALRYLSRAVTPPGRPRRFDTRFFVADRNAVAAIDPECVGENAELEEIKWVEIAAAREMKLAPITLVVLDELLARLQADPELSPEMPVPLFRWNGRGFMRYPLIA